MAVTKFPCLFHHLQPLTGTLLTLLVDALQYLGLCLRLPAMLAAENLFLRKQLALYQERHVKPKRATHRQCQGFHNRSHSCPCLCKRTGIRFQQTSAWWPVQSLAGCTMNAP